MMSRVCFKMYLQCLPQLRLVRMHLLPNPPAQRVNLCESYQAYAVCSRATLC